MMDWQDKCFSWRDLLSASQQEDAFNDVEFVVKGVVLKANSWILAMASPVMFANFFGPLAVKDGNPVYINDEMGTARGFRAMINFIYNEDKYSITDLLEGKEEITESDELEKLMELLTFGDKYQIKSLVIFCRNVLIQKIKFSRENVSQMYEVICKYNLLNVEYQMLITQMKAYQSSVVDVPMFRTSVEPSVNERTNFQLKFKVNQEALFHFDAKNHHNMNYDHQDEVHGVSHYQSISWEPKNGRREIEGGDTIGDNGIITCKFYAQANTEITLGLLMSCSAGTYSLKDYILTDGFTLTKSFTGKFSAEDLEIEIIEVNNKPFMEAITSHECLPLAKLSFQRLGWGA